ncbi:methyltransferase family protein [Phyllobacterium sp. 22552]|uniref:methyltransferase family protein n=1 Tax=Phyllobacterium sp. 22552 TaxID=3453941 RepID=UPI003F828F82
MSTTPAITHDLGRTQSRRKMKIRLALLLFSPALLFTTGIFEPGSWQREALEGVGVLLVFLAILGRAWSTLYIGGRKIDHLVTAGPYSVTRNPLYLFSFVAVLGLGLQTGSITIALGLLVAYAIFWPVVLREEATLHKIHGVLFEIYRNSVPRFAPRRSLWKDAHQLEIDPRRLRQTVLDGLIMLALIPLIRGIGWLQASTPNLPVLALF